MYPPCALLFAQAALAVPVAVVPSFQRHQNIPTTSNDESIDLEAHLPFLCPKVIYPSSPSLHHPMLHSRGSWLSDNLVFRPKKGGLHEKGSAAVDETEDECTPVDEHEMVEVESEKVNKECPDLCGSGLRLGSDPVVNTGLELNEKPKFRGWSKDYKMGPGFGLRFGHGHVVPVRLDADEDDIEESMFVPSRTGPMYRTPAAVTRCLGLGCEAQGVCLLNSCLV